MEPSTLAKVTDFEGHRVTTVIFEGRPAWIAAQVGEALGYAEGRHLVDKIAASWRDDFIDGTDFEILSNGRLAKFRADSGESQESPPREGGARSLTILYESGLHLALLRTRKPAGRRLRRLLATEVLPQLARTGRYEPGLPAPAPPPMLPAPLPPADPARELLAARLGVRFLPLPPTVDAMQAPAGDVLVRASPTATLVELETAALMALAHFGRAPFTALRFGDLHGWPRLCQVTREVFPRTTTASLAALARWPIPGGVLPTPHLVSTLAPAALAHTPIA